MISARNFSFSHPGVSVLGRNKFSTLLSVSIFNDSISSSNVNTDRSAETEANGMEPTTIPLWLIADEYDAGCHSIRMVLTDSPVTLVSRDFILRFSRLWRAARELG